MKTKNLTIIDGILQEAIFIASPNYNKDVDIKPELIVVHGISLPPGEFSGDGVTQLFTNSINPAEHPYYAKINNLKVSTHLFIRRDGTLIQYVPLHKKAWHAGVSIWNNKPECNNFSIGIELEGTDFIAYRAEQYVVLSDVIKVLQKEYKLKQDALVGHNEISPDRKTDPGDYFNWTALMRLLQNV